MSQKPVNNKVKIGVTFSAIEVEILKLIERILNRTLSIQDLVGTREIKRLSDVWPAMPEIFGGYVNLRSLETNFRFCLQNKPTLWRSRIWDVTDEGVHHLQAEPYPRKTSVVIARTWAFSLEAIYYFERGIEGGPFREVFMGQDFLKSEKAWGGKVPQSVKEGCKTGFPERN